MTGNGPEVIAKLRAALDAQKQAGSHLELVGITVNDRLFTTVTNSEGRPFQSFCEFALHPRPEGLGVCQEHTAHLIGCALKRLWLVEPWVEMLDKIVLEQGRPRKNAINGEVLRFYPLPRSPNNWDRIVLRLYRERRDLFSRVVAREMSAHKAALEAKWFSPAPAPEIEGASILLNGDLTQLSTDQKLAVVRKIYQ